MGKGASLIRFIACLLAIKIVRVGDVAKATRQYLTALWPFLPPAGH